MVLQAVLAALADVARTPNSTGEEPRGAMRLVPRRGSLEKTTSGQLSTSESATSSTDLGVLEWFSDRHAMASQVQRSPGQATAAVAPILP